MRSPLLVSALFALTACGQPPAGEQPQAPPATASTPATPASATHASEIEGWETDASAYARIGSTFPSFTEKRPDKTEFNQEAMRGRWTVVGFISEPGGGKDEETYASAIVSAADQDPDLDVLWALTAPITQPGPAPSINGAELAKSLRIEQTPTYLLVGPDLTIEGYRGALHTTPDNGIKSVIRGVAQVRKQIASPQ